jgi:hypothetical protein
MQAAFREFIHQFRSGWIRGGFPAPSNIETTGYLYANAACCEVEYLNIVHQFSITFYSLTPIPHDYYLCGRS